MSGKREERISRTLPERARGFDVMTSREIPSRVSRVFAGEAGGGREIPFRRAVNQRDLHPFLSNPPFSVNRANRSSATFPERDRAAAREQSERARARARWMREPALRSKPVGPEHIETADDGLRYGPRQDCLLGRR